MDARLQVLAEGASLDEAIRGYSPEIAAPARTGRKTSRGHVVLKSKIAT